MYGDILVTSQIEFSPEELEALDRVMTFYRETRAEDPIVNTLSIEIKEKIRKISLVASFANNVMDGNVDDEVSEGIFTIKKRPELKKAASIEEEEGGTDV